MASLKDLRNRIASVKATQKITKAMQMVAAAKLRRAQEAAEAARPYAERMDRVLANLSAGMAGRADAPALLAGTGKDNVHLVIVATADRGLCGGFNSSIARLARTHIRKLIGQGKTVRIVTVGRKGRDALRRDFGMRIDHAFRRWLIGTVTLGYGTDNYEGSDREDDRYTVAAAMIYKMTRELHFKAEARREWLKSTVEGQDYTTNIFTVGLRLQR